MEASRKELEERIDQGDLLGARRAALALEAEWAQYKQAHPGRFVERSAAQR